VIEPEARTLAGLVLAREHSGERFLKITVISPETGAVMCLLRTAAKSSVPDLFDTAELTLEPARGSGPRFASDYRVLRREGALGADYARLALACRFALIVAKNPASQESYEPLYALSMSAVSAFATRPRPDATLLKALWSLVREGGWPVREHWLAGLPEESRVLCAAILSQPLDAQEAPPEAVAQMIRNLEHWMEYECQFVIPGPAAA
jgi:recombinational DNA repair protein (RecF pathway)